jgi:hypothetical protein
MLALPSPLSLPETLTASLGRNRGPQQQPLR